VVYDALASDELLELAGPNAVLYNVGKRGHEAPTVAQEDTTALLLRLAREGKQVVRLKGDAGVPFEVVPGVSSIFGALAYAGIPITDRRMAASFAVVTGHKDPTKVSLETRWDELAHAADTLLILMGMRNLGSIVDRLLAAGRAPSTPAAAIMNGTLPTQRVVESSLENIAVDVEAAGLGAPSIIVVGDVVSLRPALAWYEAQPLFGRRVLVTRSAEQSGPLARLLSAAGAIPVLVPMIELREPEDPGPLDEALALLAGYDALVFTSANAVRFTARRALARGVALDGFSASVICVGPRTADAALAAGFPVHRVPESRFDAEGVLEVVCDVVSPRGRKILIPRSEAARDVLPDGLRELGARVDAVTAYRNVAAPVDVEALRADLVSGGIDVLTFASPSTVRRFLGHLDPEAREAAARCVVAAIGPVTANALEKAGLPPQIVPDRSEGEALVAALADSFR
jgi:uroporphyrinogen III methyltransferase/synthase